ncbi:hypothetical protein [Natronoarchaeum philippinense]|nr:hypothetical protein [Natronoarchaeum philippinense]
MQIAVFDATGRTSVSLLRQALDCGSDAVTFARSPEKLPVVDPTLTVVQGDAYSGDCVRNDVHVGEMPKVISA